MNKLTKSAAAVVLSLATAAAAQNTAPTGQTITRAGASRVLVGPTSNFTGKATVRPLVDPVAPGRTSVALVTFEPGARSNWHTHPGGQTLYVEEGCGWTQEEGGPVTRVCKGDTVFARPGVKHWHGATASTSVTYLTITETVDGRNVDWLQPVSTEEYRANQ
jgi:quercetin dioxygenase-like cupin family protein